jgi:hypothetical protein
MTFDDDLVDNPLQQVLPLVADIGQRIGQLLASGSSTPKIIQILLAEGYTKTREEAAQALRAVYVQWKDTSQLVNLDTADIREWHLQMRHELLEHTMVSAPRVALAVLESLAALQQVTPTISDHLSEIPLVIQLLPAPVVAASQPQQSIASTPKEQG